MLGGIRMPKKPQALISAVAYFFAYPAFSSSGSIMPPMPVMVASDDPVIAPKSIQVTMVTAPAAPLILPKMALANRMMAEDIPEADIRSPAKINAGIARKVKMLMDRNMDCAMATVEPPANINVKIAPIPIAKGIGTLIKANNKKINKKIPKYIIVLHLPFQVF